MHRYSVFGLVVESALELPAAPLNPHSPHRPSDVVVRIQGFLDGPSPGAAETRSIDASPTETTLVWDDVGKYCVRGGTQIDIRPRPGVEERVLGLFVTGTVFAMLLYQRGHTVLHGSAVNLAGQGVGFLGNKGAGKSTLAMGMQQIGGQLVTDDLLAIHTGPDLITLPGFLQMKLWPDALAGLGYRPDELEPLRPEVEKRGVLVAASQQPEPVPLRHIFVIYWSDAIRFTPLHEKDALLALLPHWYPARFGNRVLQQMQAQTTQFTQCVALARNIPVTLLGRPAAMDALPDIAEAVRAYVEDNASAAPRTVATKQLQIDDCIDRVPRR